MMRLMILVKASKASEAGVLPTEQELADKGARIRFSGPRRTVTDGPFAETKELVAGFWIWEVRSKEEALEWAKRIPFTEGEVEIRQVFEAEDFGEAFTPELREQEERLRLRVEKR